MKPFGLHELLARIRAVLRRTAGEVTTAVQIGAVTIDFRSHAASRNGVRIPLTAQEFAALGCLARRRGQLVSRDTLAAAIRPPRPESGGAAGGAVSNIVDVVVLRLRKKLGRELITTLRGQGFIIDG